MKFFLSILATVLTITTFPLGEAYNLVCYYQSWAIYRPGNGKLLIDDINPRLCTHLIYAFGGINAEGEVLFGDENADIFKGGYKKFNALRSRSIGLKTLLALGGKEANSSIFSHIVNNSTIREIFANNIVNFIGKYGFNGIDIDWEFPTQLGGIASDKQSLIELLKLLRPMFDANGYILSVAVSAGVVTIKLAYDIPQLAKYVDLINVMTYDLHGSWDSRTGENAPLYAGPSDKTVYEKMLNVDYAIRHWIKKGVPPNKLNLGIGTYGRSFTLNDPSKTGVGAPSIGSGEKGPYLKAPGCLSYLEICEDMKKRQWNFHWNNDQKSCYAVRDDQWVGYDNEEAIKIKTQYIVNNSLGGAMLWSVDMDDFKNSCGDGKYPLLKSINSVFNERSFFRYLWSILDWILSLFNL